MGYRAEVLAIGTPALWWAMIPACIGLTARWVSRRDWRASALLLLTAVSVLAWVPSDLHHRTMFLFYALPSVPFLCLGLALLAGQSEQPGAKPGLLTIAGVVGVMAVAAARVIHQKPVLTPWLGLGVLPSAVVGYLVLGR